MSRQDDVGMTLAQRLWVWYRSDSWGRQGPPGLLKEAAETAERADRLQASLEGLHFHHKVFEPDCRHCRDAVKDFPCPKS